MFKFACAGGMHHTQNIAPSFGIQVNQEGPHFGGTCTFATVLYAVPQALLKKWVAWLDYVHI